MDAAKTLIRTVTRTFFSTRQVLIIDALFIHSVLHADDLAILLSTQPKEIRSLTSPLREARLLSTATRTEARVGSTRGVQREYYYIPLHPAVDAIKYKIVRLREKVNQLYQVDVKRKAWLCVHCKAEWDEMEVLDKVGSEGFECHRCGHVLVPIDREEDATGGSHEKIRRLNIQLKVFDSLIAQIDTQQVSENRFEEAWERRKEVPRERASGQSTREFIAVGSSHRGRAEGNGPGETDARRLDVLITSGDDGLKVEEAEKERRRKELAKRNRLPEWHTNPLGAAAAANVKSEEMASPLTNGMQKQEDEDNEDQKAINHTNEPNAMQSEMDAYLAELEREKAEARRLAAESDAEDNNDDDDDNDDEMEMEDVLFVDDNGTSNTNTPISSQPGQKTNGGSGIKREFIADESPPSSDANTPVPPLPELEGQRGKKRPRRDDDESDDEGDATMAVKGEDSEEEEGDFEDAI